MSATTSPLNRPCQPILLKNGRILDPASNTDRIGDLLLCHGRIAASSETPPPLPDGVEIIDVTGKWVVPGLIDMHVHLREPGEEYKETVASGTMAAASGGFTAIACMPNTKPVNDCAAVTALILKKAGQGHARVYPVGAISAGSDGKILAPFGELKTAGCVAVSDDGRPVRDSLLMRRALEYSGNFGLLVISHCEDPYLSQSGAMNEGAISTALGLRGIPNCTEAIMVYRDIALAEFTGRPLHIAHVSTRESVDLIRQAKARGCQVTAETAPHYFTLTEDAVFAYNTNAKMNPPLRSNDDHEAIKQALAEGVLDAIATDHAPHSILEKEIEFDYAANGIIGLETALPLSLQLVRDGIIDPLRLVSLLAAQPAAILNVQGGSLAAGASADVTVIDPDLEFIYAADQVVSKSKNSPFLGCSLKGRAILTILGGTITYRLVNCDLTHN